MQCGTKVQIRTFEKVRGQDYEGWLRLGGVKLDYTVHFDVPIAEFLKHPKPNSVAEIRQHITVTMQKDGSVIDLTDNEFSIFIGMLVDRALASYSRNEGRNAGIRVMHVLHAMQSNREPEPDNPIESTEYYDVSPERLKLLSDSKFGCQFAA